MTRTRGPLLVAAATVAVALAAFAAVELTSGGTAKTVPLATLVRDQHAYLGRDVTTSGTVRRFTDPDGSSYYMLTDSRQDRVVLRPASAARRYVGRAVSVDGTFRFTPGIGRVLQAQHVRAVDRTSAARGRGAVTVVSDSPSVLRLAAARSMACRCGSPV